MKKEELQEMFDKSYDKWVMFVDMNGRELGLCQKTDYQMSKKIKYFNDRKIEYKTIDVFGHEIEIGGVAGGSCWDDGSSDPHYSYTRDEKFEGIKVLEDICELINISFMDYKKLQKNILTDTYNVSEYYGNYRTMCIYYIKLDDVFSLLSKYDFPTENTNTMWGINDKRRIYGIIWEIRK